MKYILIAVALLISACTPTGHVTSEETIEVPIILFLTGNNAAIGEEIHDAFLLAEKDFENTHPGVQVELLIEDSADNPTQGLNAYHTLSDREYYIVTGDAVAAAIVPAAAQDGNIIIGTTTSAPELTGENFYRGFFTSEEQGRALGTYLHEQGKERVAVLTINNQFSTAFTRALREELGTAFIAEERYNIADTDVKTTLLKIEQQKPDALIIAGFGPAFPIAFQQVRELSIDTPLYASDAIGTPYFFAAAGGYEALENVTYWSTAFDTVPQTEKLAAFYNEYETTYGQKPSLFSGYAYDTLMHTLQADYTCEDIKDCLETQTTEGLLGRTQFNSQQLNAPTYIRQFTQNSSVLLHEN
jgi:ABC-type branched-subunit amino acid transport system substrate-binding protein